MNKYKIDYNTYGYERPYAVFAKLHWWHRWEQIQSYATREECQAHIDKLRGLPIYTIVSA